MINIDSEVTYYINRLMRLCTFCDLSMEENVHNLIVQCPKLQTERDAVFNETLCNSRGSPCRFKHN